MKVYELVGLSTQEMERFSALKTVPIGAITKGDHRVKISAGELLVLYMLADMG